MKTTKDLIEALEKSQALKHEVVSIGGKAIYFQSEFIRKCVMDLVKIELRLALDTESQMSPLERLGLEVLVSSFGIEIPQPSS